MNGLHVPLVFMESGPDVLVLSCGRARFRSVSSADDASQSSQSQSNASLIIGVVAGLIVAALLAILALFVVRRYVFF
jgi:hypothetical protein